MDHSELAITDENADQIAVIFNTGGGGVTATYDESVVAYTKGVSQCTQPTASGCATQSVVRAALPDHPGGGGGGGGGGPSTGTVIGGKPRDLDDRLSHRRWRQAGYRNSTRAGVAAVAGGTPLVSLDRG